MAMAVGLLLFVATGCTAAHHALVADKRASTSLAAAAEAYWFALRWNDADAAASFLDTSAARLGLTQLVEKHTLRLADVNVVQVEVGPATLDHPREGVARVRVEAYAAAGTRLTQEVIEQHWFQTSGGAWRVDTGKSPVTEERLW